MNSARGNQGLNYNFKLQQYGGGGLRENDIFSPNNCGKYNCSTLLIQILSLRDRHLGKRKYNTDSKIYLNIRCAQFSFIRRGKSVAVMEKSIIRASL